MWHATHVRRAWPFSSIKPSTSAGGKLSHRCARCSRGELAAAQKVLGCYRGRLAHNGPDVVVLLTVHIRAILDELFQRGKVLVLERVVVSRRKALQ
eukprot:3969570-Prymnesium_polylepis.1